MSEKPKCSGRVRRGWREYPCNSSAKYVHEDRPYCGTHYPPNVEAEEELAEYDNKRKEAEEHNRKASDYDRLAAENEQLKTLMAQLEEISDALSDYGLDLYRDCLSIPEGVQRVIAENERLKAELAEVSAGLSDAARAIVSMTKENERLKARLVELLAAFRNINLSFTNRTLERIEAQWAAEDAKKMTDQERVDYVLFDLAPSIDTVALLTCEEVSELIARARTGEFDDDMRRTRREGKDA